MVDTCWYQVWKDIFPMSLVHRCSMSKIGSNWWAGRTGRTLNWVNGPWRARLTPVAVYPFTSRMCNGWVPVCSYSFCRAGETCTFEEFLANQVEILFRELFRESTTQIAVLNWVTRLLSQYVSIYGLLSPQSRTVGHSTLDELATGLWEENEVQHHGT